MKSIYLKISLTIVCIYAVLITFWGFNQRQSKNIMEIEYQKITKRCEKVENLIIETVDRMFVYGKSCLGMEHILSTFKHKIDKSDIEKFLVKEITNTEIEELVISNLPKKLDSESMNDYIDRVYLMNSKKDFIDKRNNEIENKNCITYHGLVFCFDENENLKSISWEYKKALEEDLSFINDGYEDLIYEYTKESE